jgi:uncharacterized protein YkuJ
MSFAIKTGSISKRKLKHYYSHRTTTPQKKSDYTKVMEKKLQMLAEENDFLAQENQILRKTLARHNISESDFEFTSSQISTNIDTSISTQMGGDQEDQVKPEKK